MSLIYVRTKPGRIARVAPKGEFIPHDTFVGVRETPYISRLLNVHKDIEKQSKKTPAPAAPVAPSKDASEAETKAKG
ncbi:hypothetical protein [Synechococcus phage Ssp-JY38]|nr:hypothetical protein [Synechococcus phage Yong-L2-223]